MNWIDKLNAVEACLETNEDIEQDFYIKQSGASRHLIAKLQVDFPWVAEDYIRFLELTNGADIAQCRFVECERLGSSLEMYGETYPTERWLPFGFEAGGDPLLLHKSGKVALGKGKSNSEEFQYLADSFSSFLSDVIMGQRYASIFRIPQDEHAAFYAEAIGEDPWLAFLVEQEWLKLT